MPIDWPVEKQVDYLIDQDSLVEANDVAARMYGYDSADEVMGKTIREIFAHDVEDARTAMRAWVQNNYRLDGCEIRQHVKPGKVRWLLMLGQGIIQDGHLLGSWSTAIDITERKLAEQAILQHQQQLRSLATELCIVEERERRRLATILHDDICQLLVSSKMTVDLELAGSLSDEVRPAFEKIGTWLEQAMEQARDLTFDLSTPMLYELGLSKAIDEWLTEKIEHEQGMPVTFVDQGIAQTIGEDISAFVFRSIRELTFNAVKHAQADHLTVTLGQDDNRIVIEVRDDGIGFNTETIGKDSTKGGFGLFSIKERLEYMGGEFSMDSDGVHGTRIVLSVPTEMNEKRKHGNVCSAD